MKLDRKRFSFAKPLSDIRTPSSQASRIHVARTKRLSNSYIRAATNRYNTQPDVPQQDTYLLNLAQIRSLKHQLSKLTSRKEIIQNPQYIINVTQDISSWENTISVVKDELHFLKKQGALRIKRTTHTERKQKQLRKQLQQQIKNYNNLTQSLTDIQQQVLFSQSKLLEQDNKISKLEDQQINTSYLNKLKLIQSLQQQTINSNKHLQRKYQTLKKERQDISQTIFEHEQQISLCQDSFAIKTQQLDSLLLQHYGVQQQSQQQEIQ